jgi:hypothetical protein
LDPGPQRYDPGSDFDTWRHSWCCDASYPGQRWPSNRNLFVIEHAPNFQRDAVLSKAPHLPIRGNTQQVTSCIEHCRSAAILTARRRKTRVGEGDRTSGPSKSLELVADPSGLSKDFSRQNGRGCISCPRAPLEVGHNPGSCGSADTIFGRPPRLPTPCKRDQRLEKCCHTLMKAAAMHTKHTICDPAPARCLCAPQEIGMSCFGSGGRSCRWVQPRKRLINSQTLVCSVQSRTCTVFFRCAARVKSLLHCILAAHAGQY